MIAAANIWQFAIWIVVVGGFFGLAGITAVVILAVNDRPVFPWGPRNRVEKAKAHTEVLQESLNQDALEVKRIALAHQRDRVLEAVGEGDTAAVMQLGLPAGSVKATDAEWSMNANGRY